MASLCPCYSEGLLGAQWWQGEWSILGGGGDEGGEGLSLVEPIYIFFFLLFRCYFSSPFFISFPFVLLCYLAMM